MLYLIGIGNRQSKVPPEHAVGKLLNQLDDLLMAVMCLFQITRKIICHRLTIKPIWRISCPMNCVHMHQRRKEIVTAGGFMEELEVRSSKGTTDVKALRSTQKVTQSWCCMLCITIPRWLLCHPRTRMFSCFWFPTFNFHSVNIFG